MIGHGMKALLVGLLVFTGIAHGAPEKAQVTLRLAHFWPSPAKQHTEIFTAWAESVEQASNGRIDVQVFPSGTLSEADHSYQDTVYGVADISATAQAYTAGRFPLSQIVELPEFGDSAVQGSCVLQKLYANNDRVAAEYDNTHVLFLFTHGPGYLHLVGESVRDPANLAGLRIRRPTAVVADMLESLGANPVGMPAPEVYQSLQRRIVNGLTMPWEGMLVFRLIGLTHHHLEIPLYRLAFVMTMNKDSYERLPPDLKRVIDDHSGMEWSLKAGRVFDRVDKAGRKKAAETGAHEIVDPAQAPKAKAAWQPVLENVTRNYLDRLRARGLPADKVYRQAQSYLSGCESS